MKDFFPLKKGAKFEYKYDSSEFEGTAAVSVVCLGVKKTKAGETALVRMTVSLKGHETSNEYEIIKKQKEVVSMDGIVVGGRTEFPLPPAVGSKWREAPDSFEITSLSASISVPAGEFRNCLQVSTQLDLGAAGSAVRYYAPDVGLVYEKYDAEDIQSEVSLLAVSEATEKELSAKTVRRKEIVSPKVSRAGAAEIREAVSLVSDDNVQPEEADE